MARKKKVVEEEVVEETKAPAKGKGKGRKKAEEKPVKEEKAPAKGKGRGKKKEEPKKTVGGGKRGRKAGVRNEITKKDAEEIQNKFEAMEEVFDDLAENVSDILEKSNKSAIAAARKNMQALVKMAKPFRLLVQDAKKNMKEVKI